MATRPNQGSGHRSAIVAAICATLVFFFITIPSSRAATTHPAVETSVLNGAVTGSIAEAPKYFHDWLNGVKASDVYGVAYKPTSLMQRICPTCVVEDEFATADTGERYAVTFYWNVPLAWTRAKTLVFIQQTIGEKLPSYTMTQGTDDNSENWFDWTKGSPVQFVYVKTFTESKTKGFEVRIGHYLAKNLHYTPYAILSSQQRTGLTDAVKNFVQLAVQNADDNFTSLRGKPTDKDDNYFDTNVSFGEFMTSCDVDGVFSTLSGSDTTPKWILECETPSLGGDKSDVEEIIRAAAANAVPGDFTVTTDPKYTSMLDYRWDRSSDSVSVEISSYDNGDGTFTYHVEIYHFLS